MPVETRWLIESRVCYQRIHSDMTLEHVTQAVEDAARWASEGVPPVYFIVDVTELRSYPPFSKVLHVMLHTSHPHVAWTVLVVRHPLLGFMGTMLTQLTGVRYHTVETVEAALQFLATRDQSLPVSTVLK